MTDAGHACRFRALVAWSSWERTGAVRERTATRVPVCEVCGRQRPARRRRPPFLREVEAADAEQLSLADEAGRAVAEATLSRESDPDMPIPAKGLLGGLATRGITGSVAEPWLERLMCAGLVRLSWRPSGRRELRSITVLDLTGLAELARPGERAAREDAVASAVELLDGVAHPIAVEARRALADEAQTISPELARALAVVARHAADGEVLAERVFSARHLGSSKALSHLRAAVEQRLGRLEALGIREGGALTLVGGRGRLQLSAGASIDLSTVQPFVGLSRETALALERVDPPARGLVAVENLAVFDACCRGEIPELAGAMFVWTAGYPGRGVRAIVERASREGSAVTAWCDLDLDGVRIARIVASWARECRFHGMAPGDLAGAARTLSLGDRARRAIERELANGREDALTDTLRALREGGVWAEQEALLGNSRGP